MFMSYNLLLLSTSACSLWSYYWTNKCVEQVEIWWRSFSDVFTHKPGMCPISSGGKTCSWTIIIPLTSHPFIREDTSPPHCLLVCMLLVCLGCNLIQAEDMLCAKSSRTPSLMSNRPCQSFPRSPHALPCWDHCSYKGGVWETSPDQHGMWPGHDFYISKMSGYPPHVSSHRLIWLMHWS